MGVVGAVAGLVLGAVSGIAGIHNAKNEAKALNRAADVNAQVYEQQSEMVKNQMRIKEYQSNREMARIRGTSLARTGKNGFMLSGSPLAVMVDNETQMELDKKSGIYNLEAQRSYLQTAANYTRWGARVQGKMLVSDAWSNMYSKVLNGAMSFSSSGAGSSMLSKIGGMFGSGAAAGYASNAGQAYNSMQSFGGSSSSLLARNTGV